MPGVLVAGLKHNPFVMDLIREQALRPLWRKSKKKRQSPGAGVNTQKINPFVMEVIKAYNLGKFKA